MSNNWWIHNDKEIRGFRAEYAFLSNFYYCEEPIVFNDWGFHYTENAFMAAKSTDPEIQAKFTDITPSEAKKLGRTIELRKDWDEVKLDFMMYFNLQKYEKNPALKKKLKETGNKYIEELNVWRDSYWGVDVNLGGQNYLGKILMKIRQML